MKQYFETQRIVLSDVVDGAMPAGDGGLAHGPTLSDMLRDVMDDPALAVGGGDESPTQADYVGGPGNDTYTGTSDNDTIGGNGGNDTLAGAGGADTIDGGDGDDILYSANVSPAWSHSYYYIASVVPVLDTGSEVDTIRGGAGNDTIFAGYGDNVDGGTDGATLLISFQGASSGVTVDFNLLNNNGSLTVGNGTITNITAVVWADGSNFDDHITGGVGYSSPDLRGLGGNDRLVVGYYGANVYGGDGNDIIDYRNSQYGGYGYGEAGNDTIYTSYFGDYYSGGDGNDTFYGVGSIHGDAGDDTINAIFGSYSNFHASYGDAGDDTFNGSIGADAMVGNAGADTFHGGDGDDRLFSGGLDTGNDSFFVSGANYGSLLDELDDGTEVDHVFGEGGNDRLAVGYGDEADGGTGTNILLLSLGGATAGVTLNTTSILAGPLSLGGQTLSNFQSVEAVWGSAFGDTITTATQSARILVHGRDGDDVLTAGGSAVIYYGDAGNDTITGSAFADTIYGGTGADTIRAGNGDDTIVVTAPTELAPGETIDGGIGYDTLSLAFGGTVDISGLTTSIERLDHGGSVYAIPDVKLTTAQFASLDYVAVNSVTFTTGGAISLAGVTWAGGNTITLSNVGNTLDLTGVIGGFYGGATINGGAGNDTITMLPGNSWDTVRGGGGNDTVYAGDGSDTVYGDDGNDTLYGGAYNDTLYGGVGVDTFHGDDGDDLIDVTSSEFTVGEVYDGGAGNDTLRFGLSASIDISASPITSIETLTVNTNGGNGAALSLTGAQLASFTTIGGYGASFTLTTGGSISLNGKTISGFFTLAPVDTVFDLTGVTLSAGSVTVNGNSGNDTLIGSASTDYLNGGDGNDRLDGAAGADQMTGGLGDDTYILDSGGDRVFENAGGGNDTIESSVTVTTTNSANVETIKLTGTANINATGTSAVANTIIGNSGNNRLDGGGGGDRMEGGLGDDTYVVRSMTDVIVEGANAGTDTVLVASTATLSAYTLAADVQVEKLMTLTPTLTNALDLTGNAFSHDIQGNAGNNVLIGGIGNDTLTGNGGIDTLLGGAGNDRLVVGVGGNGSIIDGGADIDTLVVTGSVSLGGLSNIEAIELQNGANLTLTDSQFNGLALGTVLSGTGTITVNMAPDQFLLGSTLAVAGGSSIAMVFNGSSGDDYVKAVSQATNTMLGGDGNDFLRGGQLADVIDGGAGGDKITGFGGADTLTGGGGADQFRYLTQNDSGLGVNADHITDFTVGTDRLNFQLFDGDTNTPDLQNPGFSFLGNTAFHATGAAEIRYEASGADMVVQVDVNGDGVVDMAIYLNGIGSGTLTGADFML